MSLIRFYGRIKSKRFDEYGNCFIGVDIEECYKISHVCNTESIGSHTPRCDEFEIVNERRLSCVNDIEIATCSEIGDRVVIEAYELFDMSGHPINRYHTVDFRNWN